MRNGHSAALHADFALHGQFLITAGHASLIPIRRSVAVRPRWYHGQRNRPAAGTDADLPVIHRPHEKPLSFFRAGASVQAAAAAPAPGSHLEDGAFNKTCRAGYRSKPH